MCLTANNFGSFGGALLLLFSFVKKLRFFVSFSSYDVAVSNDKSYETGII